MSAETRGFLMANDMNYNAFDKVPTTSYQHCLAKENLTILESSIDILKHYPNQPGVKEFSHQLCHLAITAQQLNQQASIEQATAVTDVNEFFVCFCKSALGLNRLPDPLARGVIQGAQQVIMKWAEFGCNLGTKPGKTVGEIANGYA